MELLILDITQKQNLMAVIRYKFTESEITGGAADGRYYTETELDASVRHEYYTETELTGGALDGRYYTETEAEALFLRQDSQKLLLVELHGLLRMTK